MVELGLLGFVRGQTVHINWNSYNRSSVSLSLSYSMISRSNNRRFMFKVDSIGRSSVNTFTADWIFIIHNGVCADK